MMLSFVLRWGGTGLRLIAPGRAGQARRRTRIVTTAMTRAVSAIPLRPGTG